MSNGGSGALPHVTEVQQRYDDTISVYIETNSFKPGQEVEVSASLTQVPASTKDDEASAFYNDTKRIAYTDSTVPGQPTVLHLEMPATGLDPALPVTVVTRVTEVWSTVLHHDSEAKIVYNKAPAGGTYQELKAVWKYQGKGYGDT
jgi:hypothetical protein